MAQSQDDDHRRHLQDQRYDFISTLIRISSGSNIITLINLHVYKKDFIFGVWGTAAD